jgi:hypothetical protein
MAKIKAVKFHTDFCEAGKIKYPAGTVLPQTEELLRCVALNFGEVVSVDEKALVEPEMDLRADKPEVDQPETKPEVQSFDTF